MHWEFDAFPAHKTRLNFSERSRLKAQKQGEKMDGIGAWNDYEFNAMPSPSSLAAGVASALPIGSLSAPMTISGYNAGTVVEERKPPPAMDPRTAFTP